MTPEHHEERLCAWAEKTGRPVLSLDYGKAPECECNLPFSFHVSATAHVPDLPIGIFVSGMWERSGKLRNLKTFPIRNYIEWWMLINFVTS
jgi:hypothetical protein